MPVKIKICGITNFEDARISAELGADALGFNFYKKSPRYVSPDDAAEIISLLPPTITKVGVFVKADLDEIRSLTPMLDLVQLHGDESPDYVSRLDAGTKVIKVFRIGDGFDPLRALEYPTAQFLLDTESRDFGGSGQRFDWDLAIRFKDTVPEFYLAGGLDPENVADAIRTVQPFAVDVCSGVESSKGQKDHRKMEAFIRNARAAI